MPAGNAAGAPGSVAPQAQAPALKFRLSNGTAAPKNDGQATEFTVDYVLEGGTLASDLKIMWVIHPAKGEDVTKPSTLRTEGKLRWFAKDVASDRGPFECHLTIVMSDGSTQPISDKTSLK